MQNEPISIFELQEETLSNKRSSYPPPSTAWPSNTIDTGSVRRALRDLLYDEEGRIPTPSTPKSKPGPRKDRAYSWDVRTRLDDSNIRQRDTVHSSDPHNCRRKIGMRLSWNYGGCDQL